MNEWKSVNERFFFYVFLYPALEIVSKVGNLYLQIVEEDIDIHGGQKRVFLVIYCVLFLLG